MNYDYPEPVAKWLDNQEAMTDSQESFQTRESDVRQFCKWLKANDKSFQPVEQERHKDLLHSFFLYMNGEDYARNTIRIRWDSLRKMYADFAGFHALFEETPFEELYDRANYLPSKSREETKSAKPYVTKEQKDKLCNNVPSPAFRNECLLRLMWQTGVRSGTAAELRIEDVNLEENKLEEFWTPKISEERTVAFKDSLNWWLDQWLNAGYRDAYPDASESDYLFLTHRNEKLIPRTPNTVVKEAASNAGIQSVKAVDKAGRELSEISSHAIRRGHAMHLLMNDVDLRTIQKRLGHASLETTIEYLPISPEDAGEKIEGIQF